ncbi:MAG: MgtC/SapB family protein [Candidatus Calescibacterium sp.]|nr:MgtC/SapB family protein [Candidatus Calescibacterium sp.]MCX7733783.1 MgtC/SapB family protein [bacterium]MDW8088115.1 MgtC/SapB family protein [Candidatus Calescibacterium sp.]
MLPEFDIVSDIELFMKVFWVLICATIAGGILGIERELARRPAGLKTLVFVTVGSSLFSFFSFELAGFFGGDPMRVASNIATGIGFLGAGAIVKRGDVIEGLTTASIIWVCGAIGLAVGAGFYISGILIALGGLVFLLSLEFIERRFIRK